VISIIYPYRNRELSRIKKSLDSLVSQSNSRFRVIFVDYGSDLDMVFSVRKLLSQYNFVTYIYSYHIDQPWSRSKAINIGLRHTETDYVFIADIDIIFHFSFVQRLYDLRNEQQSVYFQVGYLSEQESTVTKSFENYDIESKSVPEGQGLSFFKLNNLLKIGGFDEFFHFWGAEDEDVHSRLKNAGFETIFYNQKILLLHQWHPVFDKSKNSELTIDLSLSNIFNLNKQKLRFNQNKKLVKVNNENWGSLIDEIDYDVLKTNEDCTLLLNKKNNIDNFINIVLPNTHSEIINIRFVMNSRQKSFKHKIKELLRINLDEYYSLKQINDLVLKNLVIYYKDYLFTYVVSSDLKSIHLKIKK
jgi:glycosyltransferase involved in cell wall biosynthesis